MKYSQSQSYSEMVRKLNFTNIVQFLIKRLLFRVCEMLWKLFRIFAANPSTYFFMIIKTKKYKLPTNTYIKLAFFNIAQEWWWAWLIPPAIFGIFAAFGLWGWGIGVALTLTILYCLFWLAQFAGITQHENTKMLFDRFSYEITSRQILMKLDAKRGMPIQWDKIQKVKVGKDHFLLIMSKVQLLYLPFSIFKDHELKFMNAILKRKKLVTGSSKGEK